MIIKKFQAGTETEAIMLAREELGKEAIVMNIKTVKPKGLYKLFKKETVEITAAVDDNISYSNEDRIIAEIQKLKKSEPPKDLEKQLEVPKVVGTENIKVEVKQSESAIEQKLNDLQQLLEQQMKINKVEEKKEEDVEQNGKNIACIQLIYNQLINNEVDEKYANQIIGEIERNIKKDVSVDNVLASIYQKIILKLGQTKVIEANEKQPKYIFFVGPTGVGKTTTIAKIASNLTLKQKLKVGLVTSDTYRIAAVEQLKTYANILGLPLKVVYNEEEMRGIRKDFSQFDIVLIDTAGRSHQNEEHKQDIVKLLHALPEEEQEVYLVLSATTKYKDLIKIAEVYKEIVQYNLIFTKLDETDSIGNIFNLKMLTGASLSYTTWGQNVPDDIGKINAQSIAKKLLGGND
ncbi:MAG: flagellar biosynthesis protein FlhF [Velocimicrobium sp.]